MATNVIARTIPVILALPQQKLQSAAVTTDTTRVFTSFASDEDIAANARDDKFVVLRPKTLPPNPATQAGAGRSGTEIDGVLSVAVWVRLWVDQQAQDDSWLTHATLGIAPLMQTITDALEQYMPTDASGYYFIQPMRLLQPGWNFPMKTIGAWGKVDSDWSLVFHLSLT